MVSTESQLSGEGMQAWGFHERSPRPEVQEGVCVCVREVEAGSRVGGRAGMEVQGHLWASAAAYLGCDGD